MPTRIGHIVRPDLPNRYSKQIALCTPWNSVPQSGKSKFNGFGIFTAVVNFSTPSHGKRNIYVVLTLIGAVQHLIPDNPNSLKNVGQTSSPCLTCLSKCLTNKASCGP
ncbi:16012_t:CDS:2, partial [Acaulospora colombiana]